ncbi:hypothetical protein [Primorskyibacter marinus]|uniref:hypothetical protein n=1 Tax=Primorskyibacter marinus TaxID=1977320 RepID=UPI000E309B91|nr:hypothetical protein [Primorskyibacter marinus]
MPFDQTHVETPDLGQALRSAGRAHLFWVVNSKDAEQFVQDLFDLTDGYEMATKVRQRARNKSAVETFKRCLATWATSLIRNSQDKDALGYLYCLSGHKNLKGSCMTDRGLRSITKAWEEIGLHEVRNGFQQKETWEEVEIEGKRWANRYQPTVRLLNLAAKHGIFPETLDQHFETDLERFKPIRLRARKEGWRDHDKGKIMAFANTAKVQKLSREIKQLNEYLAEQTFEGTPHPTLFRSFNNGDDTDFRWNKGGRFYAVGYGNYQGLSSDNRRKITINGKATTELDIRASHPTLVYGLLEEYLDVERDPYEMPGLDRLLAKRTIVAMIGNGGSLDRWPKDLKAEYTDETGKPFPKLTGKQACKIVLKRHPCFSRLEEASLDWSKLQFVEAEILLKAMRVLKNELATPSLPVHDSLIVPEDKKGLARHVLQSAFYDHCGITPKIEGK